MGVDETISQAEYGIRRMRENATPFDFYLKGTLACLKGVLDYLLEEYNTKYSVGIKDSENLCVDSFKRRVQRGKNRKAESFIECYKKQKKELLDDPKCAKLLETHGSRDIIIHRREPSKSINLTLYAGMSASVQVVVRDAKGNVVATGGSPPRPATLHPTEVRYFLQDWSHDDIPTLCEYNLNKLKDLVKEIRAKYP